MMSTLELREPVIDGIVVDQDSYSTFAPAHRRASSCKRIRTRSQSPATTASFGRGWNRPTIESDQAAGAFPPTGTPLRQYSFRVAGGVFADAAPALAPDEQRA